MAQLDLRHMAEPGATTHFGLVVDGRTIAYAYIRKNACTTFKAMFEALSRFEEDTALKLMMRHHRIKSRKVRKADLRLCVLRHPEDRIRSLYRNKFIQRNGCQDLFSSYARVTGRDPMAASYRDFVTLYLSRPLPTLDPHARTQMSCLMPVRYDHVLRFETLLDDVTAALGPGIARRFFTVPTNATSTLPKYREGIVDTEARILAARFAETGRMPDDLSFADEALSRELARIYADDFKLLAMLRPD